MAWWITVYCGSDVAIDGDALIASLRGRDAASVTALAEDYEVDAAAVETALTDLRVTDALEVFYRADPSTRPIVVHVWREAAMVAEELVDARETRGAPAAAEPYPSRCAAIVALELGFSNLEDVGVVIAYEIARHLAQTYDGVIVDDDDRWERVEHGALVPLDD